MDEPILRLNVTKTQANILKVIIDSWKEGDADFDLIDAGLSDDDSYSFIENFYKQLKAIKGLEEGSLWADWPQSRTECPQCDKSDWYGINDFTERCAHCWFVRVKNDNGTYSQGSFLQEYEPGIYGVAAVKC